jgi:hypothetical protein
VINAPGQVERALTLRRNCVVILDDAQKIFGEEYESFFALFKNEPRILIAIASYNADSVNIDTPVDFQENFSCELVSEEDFDGAFDTIVVGDPQVVTEARDQLLKWFGASFGRISILGEQLLALWIEEQKKTHESISLDKFYYRASTLTSLKPGRFVPGLAEETRNMLMRHMEGGIVGSQLDKLMRYGILDQNKEWSCDFVCRYYFTHIFHLHDQEWAKFSGKDVPSCMELLQKGLVELNWRTVRDCKESSSTSFPIENVWQTVFYSAIGRYIPASLTFCKERVVDGKQDRLDFVLRNGSTLGIELLIKSDRVKHHHARFEDGGGYYALSLDEHLVCDIAVWDSGSVFNEDPAVLMHRVITMFDSLSIARRAVHSVFLVGSDLSGGILYKYSSALKVVQVCRSPKHT